MERVLPDAVDPSDAGPLLRITANSPRPGVLVVEIVGELDLATAPHVTEFLHQNVGPGARHLALDLSGIAFIGSHGISMLVTALNDLGKAEELHLVGATGNPRVWQVLEVTGLTGAFCSHTDVDELLAELGET